MDIEIREFITYLHNRKRTSHNTEVSYQRDLKKMAVYFADRGIYDIRDVGELEPFFCLHSELLIIIQVPIHKSRNPFFNRSFR